MSSSSIYCVYKHTSPSGKSYIGITSNYTKRCQKHRSGKSGCPAFYAAIKKYGWDNFTHTILAGGLDLNTANEHEIQLISNINTVVPNGYNLEGGGKVKVVHESTKAKIAAANLGKITSNEVRKKISNSSKGKIISAEAIAKRLATRIARGINMPSQAVALAASIKACAKNWSVTSPEGVTTVINNLSAFCRTQNLNRVAMQDVANGFQTHHRQWKCSRA